MEHDSEQEVLAAIDLGSNSFHMIIARLRDGHFQVVDRLREMVQLRAGLQNHRLSEESQERAIACLERFGQRIKDLPTGSVRVVGTNTLRVAENSRSFLRRARIALGHSIDVIAGEEEARLIYLGVSRALAFDESRRLVMDIGGGSTEFIIGEGLDGLMRDSLEMGCVSFSQRFFRDGIISKPRVRMAMVAAGTRLRSIEQPFKQKGWIEAVGASGTIRCVANIVKENNWSDDGVITPESLDKLIDTMVEEGNTEQLNIAGLSPERANVLAGGVCILRAAFERLDIERMIVSDGALREGLLYDLLGRIQHDDERERTVEALANRYHVDEKQTERVTQMATELFEQVAKDWSINTEANLQQLQWAAKLHEIGLAISHNQYHKHSSYLVGNTDLPGFSREEQHALAAIVRGQRRKFPKSDIKKLPTELQDVTKQLTMLLRLAVVFNRGRSELINTHIELEVINKGLRVILPEGWLETHPLTEADLNQEAEYLQSLDTKLKLSSSER
jgi:exopolyphosphatase/guanosine-5'-triphosphate,3'-diphosphate pyrophosphatase